MEKPIVIIEDIISQIFYVRGMKVMVDSDLARIYGVTTRRLNQQVHRNIDRFPSDFMFELSSTEYRNLMLQFATSSLNSINSQENRDIRASTVMSGWGGRRKSPKVFTEHGALMLASVLNSPVSVQASIFVVRAFIRLRDFLTLNKELSKRIDDLEKNTVERLDEHSEQLAILFQTLKELIQQNDDPMPPIGFKY